MHYPMFLHFLIAKGCQRWWAWVCLNLNTGFCPACPGKPWSSKNRARFLSRKVGFSCPAVNLPVPVQPSFRPDPNFLYRSQISGLAFQNPGLADPYSEKHNYVVWPTPEDTPVNFCSFFVSGLDTLKKTLRLFLIKYIFPNSMKISYNCWK